MDDQSRARYRKLFLIILPFGLVALMLLSLPALAALAQATFTPTPVTTAGPEYWTRDEQLTTSMANNGYWYETRFKFTTPPTQTLKAIVINSEAFNKFGDNGGPGVNELFWQDSSNYRSNPAIQCFGHQDACAAVGYGDVWASATWRGDKAGNLLVGSKLVCQQCGHSSAITWVKGVYWGVEPYQPPDPDCQGIIYDGGMEQMPISSFWVPEEADRVNARIDGTNILNMLRFGSAACGNGMQLVGGYECGFLCGIMGGRGAHIGRAAF